jgi:hypothetical protein
MFPVASEPFISIHCIAIGIPKYRVPFYEWKDQRTVVGFGVYRRKLLTLQTPVEELSARPHRRLFRLILSSSFCIRQARHGQLDRLVPIRRRRFALVHLRQI